MNAFYSMIYYQTNSLTDEMVSIAMLAGGGEGPFIYISKARLALLKKTIDEDTYVSLKRHLKSLKSKVDKHRENADTLRLFDPVFSSEQLKKISKETNGNIIYSPPTTVNDWLNETVFEKLVFAFFSENV